MSRKAGLLRHCGRRRPQEKECPERADWRREAHWRQTFFSLGFDRAHHRLAGLNSSFRELKHPIASQKLAEQSYGADHLNLVLAKGYLCKLLGNARVLRYLAQHDQEILTEFQRIPDLETVAA